MRTGPPTFGRRLALATVGALIVFVSVAAAVVTVYKNDFSSKSEAREIENGRGKHCNRDYNSKRNLVSVTVQRGPESCGYVPPVEGDRRRPDHIFSARTNMRPSTPKPVRDEAFIGLAARVGKGDRYEFRITPRGRRFKLKRMPDGPGFPVQGSSGAIDGLGEVNRLVLRVIDNKIKGFVNGRMLASVTDPDAGDVKGRRLEFILGRRGKSGKNVHGAFDKLRLAVPNP